MGLSTSRGSAVSVSHREPERYSFTLGEYLSGGPRVLFLKHTGILMKNICQSSGFLRLGVLQTSRKHEKRRTDTFGGGT